MAVAVDPGLAGSFELTVTVATVLGTLGDFGISFVGATVDFAVVEAAVGAWFVVCSAEQPRWHAVESFAVG